MYKTKRLALVAALTGLVLGLGAVSATAQAQHKTFDTGPQLSTLQLLDVGPASGATHPYRLIVQSSSEILRKQVSAQLGDARVRIYQLSFGSTERRQYMLSVETTMSQDEVIDRLKKLPGVSLVSEDSLMKPN